MVDNFIGNFNYLNDKPEIDTNFLAKLDGFIKYLKIVKTNFLENKVPSKSIKLIDKTISEYYDNSIKLDNYENGNYLSFENISDDDTSSVNSNDVEFVDSSDDEEYENPQIAQFNFLAKNPYDTFSYNHLTIEKKKEPVKIDENIEQKKIDFSYYKFYKNNQKLEKRYKKYIEKCFIY